MRYKKRNEVINLNKTLAIIFLTANVPFALAMGLGSSPTADGFYTLTGLVWVVIGNWMAIRTLNNK